MTPATIQGADELLAALDPEQRDVAVALQGPVRVLAGAGTGKTRAITHRIAYGVATGVYNPTEVLAVTFTTRAAGEMRTRLRGLGAGGVQARTFHSAALRQARFFWPKVYGGELPELTESKLGLLGNAARRNRVATDQATLRDLASEVEWAKVSNVRPDDYARVAHAARPLGQRARRGDRRPRLRDLRGRQARPGPDGHGGRAALRRGAARRGRARRRPGPPAVQVVRRRRVPGRQPDPVRAARPVARRPRRASASSATRRRRSTPSPGANASYLRDFPRQAPRHDVGRAGPQLPLHAAGDRRRQPAAAGARPARACSCAPSRRAGPRSGSPSTPTRSPRPSRSPPTSLGLVEAGTPAARDRRAVPDQRAVRGVRGGARGPRRPLRRPRRRPVLRPGRGEAGGGAAARRRPQRRRRPGRSSRPARAVLAGMGWSAQAPTGRGTRPRPLGVAAGAGLPGRGPRRRRGPTPGWSTSSPSSTAAPTSSTPRSPRASRSRRCTPPRASSGTSSSCAGMQEGTMPIVYAEGAGRDRGGAPAALRRDDPRPSRS